MRIRTGRRNLRNLYLQQGGQPADTDPCLGLIIDPVAAADIVDAVNRDPGAADSDGYHTFGELYNHRRALTAALATVLGDRAWRSKAHHPGDAPMFVGGYFIVGIDLPTGTITYHYQLKHWDDFPGINVREHAPKWDGATPADTVTRLRDWVRA